MADIKMKIGGAIHLAQLQDPHGGFPSPGSSKIVLAAMQSLV